MNTHEQAPMGSAYDVIEVPVLWFVDDACVPNEAARPLFEPGVRLERAPGVGLAPRELVDLDVRLRSFGAGQPTRTWQARTRRPGEDEIVVTLIDVTDQQAREDAESLLSWQSELSGAGAWEVDLVTNQVAWSAQVKRIHEVPDDYVPSVDDAIGFYAPEARPVITAAVERAVASGAGFDLELPLITAQQRRIWVRSVGKPLYQDGECIRLRGTFQDVTQRREHAASLQAALDQVRDYQRVFETAPTMQCIANANGTFQVVNPYWTKVLGWTEDELRSRPYIDFVHPEDVAETLAASAALAESSTEIVSFQNRYRTRDAGYRTLRWYAVSDHSVGKIYAVAVDISEERAREAELQRLANVANRTQNGVLVTDADGRVEWVNPAFERIVGYTLDEMIGHTPGRVLQGPATDEAEVNRVRRAIRAQQGFRTELLNYRKSGEAFWNEIDAQPVFGDDGRLRHFVAIQSDITERKRIEGLMMEATAEAKRAADAAAEASEAKSLFLANMSHEIRTPLNGVIGVADMLLEREGDDEQRQLVQTIRDSGNVLLELVNDILDFSKIEAGRLELEAEPVDVAELIERVARIGRVAADDKGLELQVRLPDRMPRVVADGHRLRQIVTNLVSNAIKFTDRGEVHLRLYASPSPAGEVGLRVEVEDTGPGIEPTVITRLFRPFTQADASTTRRFGGTGLGLSICRSLAEQMGGRLGVTSEVGKGACFSLELSFPRAPDAPRPVANLDGPLGHGPLGGSVLLVEDNRVNQRVAAHMLRRAGCEVTIVDDGQAGVERARGGGFDLVLMDCQMPRMDGFEATRHIRALEGPAGQVPIIALTASTLLGDRQRCLEAGMTDFLAKPIRPDELDDKLRRHLPGARGPELSAATGTRSTLRSGSR